MNNELNFIQNEEFRQMLAERIKALGDPTRIHLLHLLMEKERNVHHLAELVNKSQATVSKHLSILYRNNFLKQRKEGVQTFYSIRDANLKHFCQFLCDSLKAQLNHLSNVGKTKEKE